MSKKLVKNNGDENNVIDVFVEPDANKATPEAWIQARQYFLSHPSVTMKELAMRFNLPSKTLYNRSRTEKWTLQRDEFQAIIRSRATTDVINRVVHTVETARQKDLDVADKLYRKVVTWLNVPDVVKNVDGKELTFPGIAPRELNALAQVALNAQRITRLALGLTDGGAAPGQDNAVSAEAARSQAEALMHEMLQLRQDRKDERELRSD